ncbi:MAG: SMC-Scp complex subunit ScpB [Bdellovibrionaceae bacterium]|nr:SMC-Scp complex subunit ScpB [Pseudobdellovibrionaceae bacterium]
MLNEQEKVSNKKHLEMNKSTLSILESLLFASEKPLSVNSIKLALEEKFSLASAEIKKYLSALQKEYEKQDRGIELVEINNAYQLRTKPENKDFVQALVRAKSFRLSPVSLEALSIIAYKQPCIKSVVDEVRGTDSSHLVRALMDRGLVKFCGKSELPGKPMLYATTDKFLEVFGLNKVSDLPSLSEVEELLPQDVLETKKTDPLSAITESLIEEQSCNDIQDQEELNKLAERLSGIEVVPEALKKKKEEEPASTEA